MRLAAAITLAVLMLTACSSDNPADGGDDAAVAAVNADARRAAAHTPAQRRAVEAQIPGRRARTSVDSAAVVRLFEHRAGVRLVVERRSGGLVTLSLPTADEEGNPLPDEQLRRFGSFTVYVAENGRRLADLGQLGDVVPRAMPDRRGIVWRADRDPLGDTLQTAHAFYADGSVMVAWLGGAKRGTDASFRRLDRLLRGLE